MTMSKYDFQVLVMDIMILSLQGFLLPIFLTEYSASSVLSMYLDCERLGSKFGLKIMFDEDLIPYSALYFRYRN